MQRVSLGLTALVIVIGFCALFALADWVPGDGYKMHFPQTPDEEGWNVMASFGQPLADDWTCIEDGPVNEIHFWGSWLGGNVGTIDGFWVTIYSDIPDPDLQDPATWSKPGTELWTRYIPMSDVIVQHITPDPQLWEGWYDPTIGEYLYPDHDNYFQYNIFDIPNPYIQVSQTVYWLGITADTDPQEPDLVWGWKSSTEHHLDNAVWGTEFGLPSPGEMTISRQFDDPDWWIESFFDVTYQIEFEGCPGSVLEGLAGVTTAVARFDQGGTVWQELFEPGADADTVFNAFSVVIDASGMLVDGFGENAYGEGWYYYPWYDWWNVWFYDHPYDDTRYKEAVIDVDIFPFEAGPSYIELAINWSTDLWSLEQPPGDSMPPLPGVNEDLYIGREVLLIMQDPAGHFTLPWIWPDYNPEWVSIDVRGFNFIIPEGIIMHACVGEGTGESMDLSFVINSSPTICCIPPMRGNIDYDVGDNIDISDLVYLVDYMFTGGPAPPCFEEADIDCSGGIDISDLVFIVDYMFNFGRPPCRCDCADCR